MELRSLLNKYYHRKEIIMNKKKYISPSIEKETMIVESLLAGHSNDYADTKGDSLFEDEDEEDANQNDKDKWK
jgi:hypothetical protein